MVLDKHKLDSAALLSGFEEAAPPDGNVVRYEHQQWVIEQFWCWAAAASMVHFSLTNNRVDQRKLAAAVLHNPLCETKPFKCNRRASIVDALDAFDQSKHVRPGGDVDHDLDFDHIKAEIPGPNSGVPVVCVLPGHCLVIFAWKQEASGERMLLLADPSEKKEEWRRFEPGSIKGDVWERTVLVQ